MPARLGLRVRGRESECDGLDRVVAGARTLWPDALVDHLAGRSSDIEAAPFIADRYRRLIDDCDATASGKTGAAP